jgi:hypothetical protein
VGQWTAFSRKTVLDETKQWPEVRKAFQDAFALYRQRNGGHAASDQTESNQIKPNQSG